MFTDTHWHFEQDKMGNFDNVIEDAQNNKIHKFILCGCSHESISDVLLLSDKFSNIFLTIGYHPDQADILTDNDIEFLKNCLKNKKVVGVGEIGLDYHYDGYDKNKQINLFEKQIKIAEELNLPVVIHSRDATQDTIDILKKYNVRGVIHSFSGSYEVANECIKMGFYLGINGVVTFKNCNLKDVLLKLSPKNIILETDSPYLTPHPFRGMVNGPKNVRNIAEFISQLYGISLEELGSITEENVSTIFDI